VWLKKSNEIKRMFLEILVGTDNHHLKIKSASKGLKVILKYFAQCIIHLIMIPSNIIVLVSCCLATVSGGPVCCADSTESP